MKYKVPIIGADYYGDLGKDKKFDISMLIISDEYKLLRAGQIAVGSSGKQYLIKGMQSNRNLALERKYLVIVAGNAKGEKYIVTDM